MAFGSGEHDKVDQFVAGRAHDDHFLLDQLGEHFPRVLHDGILQAESGRFFSCFVRGCRYLLKSEGLSALVQARPEVLIPVGHEQLLLLVENDPGQVLFFHADHLHDYVSVDGLVHLTRLPERILGHQGQYFGPLPAQNRRLKGLTRGLLGQIRQLCFLDQRCSALVQVLLLQGHALNGRRALLTVFE